MNTAGSKESMSVNRPVSRPRREYVIAQPACEPWPDLAFFCPTISPISWSGSLVFETALLLTCSSAGGETLSPQLGWALGQDSAHVHIL